jgi:Conjugative transposon protein TcpC
MSPLGLITRQPLRGARIAGVAPRIALYAVTTVLCAAGVASIVRGHKTIHETFVTAGHGFDLAAAEYATEFARVYLTYSSEHPGVRTEALSRFTNSAIDNEAGVTPQGAQTVTWAEPVQQQRQPTGEDFVTVAVQTGEEAAPQYLAVPVIRDSGGALAIANYPSFVGPPAVATGYEAPDQEPVTDSALIAMVTRVVTNYLDDDALDLQADMAPEVQVSLPTGALTVQHVTNVTWAYGASIVEVDVQAVNSAGTTFSLAYLIGVVHQERWYATSISVNPAST